MRTYILSCTQHPLPVQGPARFISLRVFPPQPCACVCAHVRAGGGAFKYAGVFRERLGVVLEKEDEMSCLVAGCNFLLKAITHEAFTYENSTTAFVPTKGERAWAGAGVGAHEHGLPPATAGGCMAGPTAPC